MKITFEEWQARLSEFISTKAIEHHKEQIERLYNSGCSIAYTVSWMALYWKAAYNL